MSKFSITTALAATIVLVCATSGHAQNYLVPTQDFAGVADGTGVLSLSGWNNGNGGTIVGEQLTHTGTYSDMEIPSQVGTAFPTLVFSVDTPASLAGAANSWFGLVGSGLGDGRFVAIEDATGSGGGNVHVRVWGDGGSASVNEDTPVGMGEITSAEIRLDNDGTNITGIQVLINGGAGYDSGIIPATSSNALADLDAFRTSGNPGTLVLDNIMAVGVPEPSSLMLLGLGGMMLAFLRHRRR